MYDNMTLRYRVSKDFIVFLCSGIDEKDEAVASLLNDFLYDLSKDKNIYVHAYRLPDEELIIEPTVILEKATTLADPFNTFFHLSEASVKSNYLSYASSMTVYFFQNNVEWTDFLATSPIHSTKKLIENGILSACFTSTDQGADFWFEGCRACEAKVFNLIEHLSALGCETKKSFSLNFPYVIT